MTTWISSSPQHDAQNTIPVHLWDLFVRNTCVHQFLLTHWGRVTHICVGKLTIIGSNNGLSPNRRQAIIWTNAGILLMGPLGTNFNENLIEIHTFSFKKMHLKMSSAKRRLLRPQCVKTIMNGCLPKKWVFTTDMHMSDYNVAPCKHAALSHIGISHF